MRPPREPRPKTRNTLSRPQRSAAGPACREVGSACVAPTTQSLQCGNRLAPASGGSGRAAVNGIEQDALRSAERADRLQAAVSDAVVNRSSRYAQDLGGVVQRYAPADTVFEAAFCECHRDSSDGIQKGTRDATWN